MLGMSVNVGSQETSISLYHSGQYMTPPTIRKYFCVEVFRSTANILYQDTIVDAFILQFWS